MATGVVVGGGINLTSTVLAAVVFCVVLEDGSDADWAGLGVCAVFMLGIGVSE